MSSGLSDLIALDTTTASTLATCAASWPIATSTPIFASRSVTGDAARSEPDTA
jgi:hypothetical protein